MQGVASLCLELEKLKLVGSEPATMFDFAVLDALWSAIVQSPAAMRSFLLADGLGALLDLVERGAAALQPLLLTILAGMKASSPVGLPICLHDSAAGRFWAWAYVETGSHALVVLDALPVNGLLELSVCVCIPVAA